MFCISKSNENDEAVQAVHEVQEILKRGKGQADHDKTMNALRCRKPPVQQLRSLRAQPTGSLKLKSGPNHKWSRCRKGLPCYRCNVPYMSEEGALLLPMFFRVGH